MRKALFIIILILMPALVVAGPAPKAKQLNIGQLTYWSDIWHNTTARSFFANHYGWTIFDENYDNRASVAASIAAMKVINPSFRAIKYTNYIIQCNNSGLKYIPDTVDIKIHAESLGISFDSLFMWTGPNADDSISIRWSGVLGWGPTILPNHKITYDFAGGMRAGLDYRNPDVGRVLGHYWRMISAQYGGDGVMPDEECPMGYAGAVVLDNGTPYAWPGTLPFFINKITGSVYDNWRYNDATTGLKKPFAVSMTQAQIDDSMARARDGWMKIASDTLRAHSMDYVPNWSANGGPIGVSSGLWNNEMRHVTAHDTKNALLGEFCNYYPSTYLASGVHCEDACNRVRDACASVKDSAVTIYVWPISIGVLDSLAANDPSMTTPRTRLNALGFMLDCLFPGNSTYKFGPCAWAGHDNSYLLSHTISGQTVNDTVLAWSESWGKWFGYPRATRDTSQTGTNDGAGQSYTIHKITFSSQNGVNDTLTLVVGRYCRGTNVTASSAVSVNLPSGTWRLINDDGSYSLASSPITIRNGEWKVFCSNTAYSDNGFADATPPVISAIDSTVNANVVTITWTTDDQATDTLEYGTTLSYGSFAGHSSLGTSHSITVTVSPSTHYHFRCRSKSDGGTTVSGDYTFTSLAADITSPTISNISVTPGPTGAVVTWTTNEPSTSSVDYGTTIGYGSTSSEGSLVLSHSRTISGLTSSTLYHFHVVSSDASDNEAVSSDGTFTTTSSGQQNNNGKKRVQRKVQ